MLLYRAFHITHVLKRFTDIEGKGFHSFIADGGKLHL